jgi:hypothetical protein
VAEGTEGTQSTESTVDWAFFSVLDYVNRADQTERAPDTAVWEYFQDRFRQAVTRVVESPTTTGAADRASAFRGLLQNVHFIIERTLGSSDPYRPVLSRPWWIHAFDWGAGNPDAVYHTAALRDDVTYRISGNKGNADFLSFELFAGPQQAGSIAAIDLDADANGDFEILFGPEKREGNWLEVVSGTSSLLSREFFSDWETARPGRFHLECLDPAPGGWPPLSGDRAEREIRAVGDWLVAAVDIFLGAHERGLTEYRNAFDPRGSRPGSGLPEIYHGFWDLQPDECLIISFAPPPGNYWGLQMANALWNTFDFAHRQTSLNVNQLDREPDGSIDIVVAHQDPGVANWLDAMGVQQGMLTLRFTYPDVGVTRRPEPTLASSRSDWMTLWQDKPAPPPNLDLYPAPTARVVRLDRLEQELPTARRVTADERRKSIDRRHELALRLVSGC